MLLNTCGKWLNEKITKFKKSLDEEFDEEVDQFIDKEYFYLLKVSSLYVKFEKRNIIFPLLQLVFCLSTMFYHIVLLWRSTLLTMRINMVIFSQSTHLVLLMVLGVIIVVYFQSKRRYMILYHKLLSCGFFDYKEPPAPGLEELRSTMTSENRLLAMIPLGVAVCCVAMLTAPVADQMVGTFDKEVLNTVFSTNLPYPYGRYPYQIKDGFSYYMTFGAQVIVGTLLTFIIGTAGFFYLNAMQNISLQLKILQNSLDQLGTRAEDMFLRLFGKSNCDVRNLYGDRQFSYCYSMCLIKSFKHHQVILRAFHYTEEILSVPMLFAYATGTIVIALSLVSAGSVKELPGTTVASMMLCGVEIGYMYLMSLFGQRIGDLNSELRFKIYCTKWYLCNRSIKSSMLIFLEMTKKPLTMKAGGIIPADMETFARVMNTAYSYYNIINALQK